VELSVVKWRKCSEVELSVVKWSEGFSNRVSIHIRRHRYRSHEFCCLYGFFVYHILSCSFGSILSFYIWFYVLYAFFNFVNYVILLLCVCILIFMYVPFCVFCFIVLFCVLFVCKCDCTAATGCQPNCGLQNTSTFQPSAQFLPQCEIQSFTPIQKNRQNYSSVYLKIFLILDSKLQDKRFRAE